MISTQEHGDHRITVERVGNKPWSVGIVRGKPEYEMVPVWKVTALCPKTGEIRVSGAYGPEGDAWSVGRGLVRWMAAGGGAL